MPTITEPPITNIDAVLYFAGNGLFQVYKDEMDRRYIEKINKQLQTVNIKITFIIPVSR